MSYRFELRTARGGRAEHPARNPDGYRFRVVEALPVRIEAGYPGSGVPKTVALVLEARGAPSGEAVVRIGDADGSVSAERRLPLEVRRAGPHAFRLSATLPSLGPGEAIDLFFEVSAAGSTLRVPADAPRVTFSWKRPAIEVDPLPISLAPVLDLAASGEERWAAFQGAGIRGWGVGDEALRGGLEGLPSGVVRSLVPDPAAGRLYLATDRGVAVREGEGSPLAWLTPIPSRLWSRTLPELEILQGARRAGPAALSSLDGTLLVQLQGAHALEQEQPPALFLEIRGSRVAVWRPPSGPGGLRLVGLSAAAFDPVDGCWLLGGLAAPAAGDALPVVIRRCGETLEWAPLPPSQGTGGGRRGHLAPERVVGVARAPGHGLVAALELGTGMASAERRWGLFLVEPSGGEPRPLASGLDDLGAEVSALATDWRRDEVLVATLGRGVLAVPGTPNREPARVEGTPDAVSAMELTSSGVLLVGTPDGEVAAIGPEGSVETVTVLPAKGLPPDALPVDAAPGTARVLLSSHREGLFELEGGARGTWHPDLSLRTGSGLSSEMRFGEAVYTGVGSGAALLQPAGMLIWNADAKVVGEAVGLRSEALTRILWRGRGELWAASSPTLMGRRASVFVLRGPSVVRTFEIEGTNAATIADWVSVPERDAVFAASRAGIVEISSGGRVSRLSAYPVSAIARDVATGAIGAAGAAVERWTGERFEPVLFGLRGPRRGNLPAGPPIDLAIDRRGLWYLLFQGGVLARLKPGDDALDLVEAEDGIPPTARALLAHPETGEIFVGSAQEGVVIVRPSE